MDNVFDSKNPQPVTVELAKQKYSRQQRRKGAFMVIVDGEYVRMIGKKPAKFDTVIEPEMADRFTWNNAELVCDHFVNPEIKLAIFDAKTRKFRLV